MSTSRMQWPRPWLPRPSLSSRNSSYPPVTSACAAGMRKCHALEVDGGWCVWGMELGALGRLVDGGSTCQVGGIFGSQRGNGRCNSLGIARRRWGPVA